MCINRSVTLSGADGAVYEKPEDKNTGMNFGGDKAARKTSIIGLAAGGQSANARRASLVEAHQNFAQINADMAKQMAGSFRGRRGSVAGRRQSLIG